MNDLPRTGHAVAPAAARTAPLALRWLGVAGFQLRWRGAELLFDPYLSRPPEAVPALLARPADFAAASLLLVSHGHFDHAQDAAALALAAPAARLVAPRVVCARAARAGVDPRRLLATEEHEELEWPEGGARVRVLGSRHIRFDPLLVWRTVAGVLRAGLFWRVWRLVREFPLGSNSDFFLELGAERLLFSGSGGGDHAALAALRPTTYLLPFAGRSDVVEYYLRALRLMRPARVVVHHVDHFLPGFTLDYPVAELRERLAVELPATRLYTPRVGDWFTLDS